MSRIKEVSKRVIEVYESKNPNRDDWADWLYKKHVFIVAEEAKQLSDRLDAKEDLAAVAGLLHDIADALMSRFNSKHEEESFVIARNILQDSGFSKEEIKIVVDDAMKFHSCRDGQIPASLEGKVMATADAIIHIKTDFYKIALDLMRKEGRNPEKSKEWALEKLERDFHDKILFDDVRKELVSEYKKLKIFLKD